MVTAYDNFSKSRLTYQKDPFENVALYELDMVNKRKEVLTAMGQYRPVGKIRRLQHLKCFNETNRRYGLTIVDRGY